MPRIKQTLIFKYEELSDSAKERARNWLRVRKRWTARHDRMRMEDRT